MTMIDRGRRDTANPFRDRSLAQNWAPGPEHEPSRPAVKVEQARSLATRLEAENASLIQRMRAASRILAYACTCQPPTDDAAILDNEDDECVVCQALLVLDTSGENPAVVDALFDRLGIGSAT